jgi:hypothetical protein
MSAGNNSLPRIIKILIAIGVIAAVAAVIVIVLIPRIELTATDSSKPDMRKLVSLPYVDYVSESEESKKKVGVQLYDEEHASPGLNLYWTQTDDSSCAYLMDMEGRIVHQWNNPQKRTWLLVSIDTMGSVVCLLKKGLIKYNWETQLINSVPGEFHHDAETLGDGRILSIKRNFLKVNHKGQTIRIINDQLTFIGTSGRISEEISLFELVRGTDFVREILDEAAISQPDITLDILHTNTANMLTKDVPGFCNKGDILVCMRNLDLIFVYDRDRQKIGWQYDGRGVWEYPHEPIFLDNGNILIFDNGFDRGYSRIIEFEPLSRQIVWEYKGSPPESFYSQDRGFIQRLPNGNTLITESNSGRVFEVTNEGKIVWDWVNPFFSNGQRVIVRKMTRYDTGLIDRINKKPLLQPKSRRSPRRKQR